MATVFLAHDLRHDRAVAIKVMRAELAAAIGAERFLQEIKTTANLQHPHILSLFDSGAVDGTVFYVMPYVEGESLRERLAREQQLPVAEALLIAREVADALQYAHGKGIIHRDIKPENILLHGGHALVADFGIALAASRTGGDRMTQTGMSLGTPQYMAPEQALGEREVDGRADLYALACVTYEMLAGEPPFTGPNAQAIVARVVTEPVKSVRAIRSSVPDHVDEALQTALQKLPADRFRSAAGFAEALSQTAPSRRPAASPGRWGRNRPFAIVAAAGLAGVAFVLGTYVRRDAQPLQIGRATHVTWDPGLEVTPALAPDGRSVAYARGSLLKLRVMVRPVGEGRPIPLTGDTTAAETNPQWSPDGSRVLFLSRGGVFSAPAGGGPARPEIPGRPGAAVATAVWSPDGRRIAFARGDSVFLREDDGSTRGLAGLSEPTMCAWAPNGDSVACVTGNALYTTAGANFGNLSPSRIALIRLAEGRVETITDSLSLNHSPVWSPDGQRLYFVSDRDGPTDVYAVSPRKPGPIVRLTTGLGAHTISLSADGGRLAYSAYSIRNAIWSLPIPTTPPVTTTAATRVTNTNEVIETLSASADGKWLWYDSNLTGNADLFRVPAAGGEPERLTTDPTDDFAAAVSPNGDEIAFHSWRSGSRDLYVMRLDGSAAQRVTHSPGQEALADWSPDGSALVFTEFTTGDGIWTVGRDARGTWGTPVRLREGGTSPVWSPDGRSIAFATAGVGGSLAVMPAAGGPETILVDATRPGTPPVEEVIWARNGTIYFVTHDASSVQSIWSVPAAGGPPRLEVRFDPTVHTSYLGGFALGGGRFFFTSEDRHSDVWVLEVGSR